MSNRLKNPIASMFHSAVKPVVQAYDREWRILPRIRELEPKVQELGIANHLLTKRLALAEQQIKALTFRLDVLEKQVTALQNSPASQLHPQAN